MWFCFYTMRFVKKHVFFSRKMPRASQGRFKAKYASEGLQEALNCSDTGIQLTSSRFVPRKVTTKLLSLARKLDKKHYHRTKPKFCSSKSLAQSPSGQKHIKLCVPKFGYAACVPKFGYAAYSNLGTHNLTPQNA